MANRRPNRGGASAKPAAARKTQKPRAERTKTSRTQGGSHDISRSKGQHHAPESYQHPTAESLLRPDVGTQAQFRKKKPPNTYRYDSSLSPELNWDGQNPARELGEWLLACIMDASRLDPPHTFPQPREFRGPAPHNRPAGAPPTGPVVATVRGLTDAVEQLRALAKPFLNWAGKAERLSFDVPTLPLFVHERLSTKAILETLKAHRRDKQLTMFDLFADPQLPIHDQVLRAYEHKGGWTNRLILGDSLAVMNSLLGYEALGGQVQMIYMDPPYGVKFGSNFQPFVRKRDVKHNDDADMTREPEMVKAYRDTWELGLHSYLTYLRDRLLLCRELLHPSGSIFLQISDENLHHARELMDEVFGETNFCGVIAFRKTSSANSPVARVNVVASVADYLLWYARDRDRTKYTQLYSQKVIGEEGAGQYTWLEFPGEHARPMTKDELASPESALALGARLLRPDNLASTGFSDKLSQPYAFGGKLFYPPQNARWKTTPEGLDRLNSLGRIIPIGKRLYYKRYIDDFAVFPLTNVWVDTGSSGFADAKLYAVQTNVRVLVRCMQMTTAAGDLVLDPTCGSGTMPYVAEQLGRRWIAIDTSRVPLALTRQRLLTATFPYYELRDDARGPAAGFIYKRRQNSKGEEVGGIVPHVTLKSIANNEPPEEEVLVDRPEEDKKVTRVTGPFCVEATIPTPVDWEADGIEDSGAGAAGQHGSFVDRMLEVLRRSPVLHVAAGKVVNLRNIRPPAKTLSLSAEALAEPNAAVAADVSSAEGTEPAAPPPGSSKHTQNGAGDFRLRSTGVQAHLTHGAGQPVAIVFGPENGAISEKLVYEAAREAHAKAYTHLYVIGFAIQPNARKLVDDCEAAVGVPATYVQATPDLMMGDLLKNMRSSQIFSVCGLPEIRVKPADPAEVQKLETRNLKLETAPGNSKLETGNWYQVEVLGLDIFDPGTMETDHRDGKDLPCWLLDTDYNALCFHVCQAFFPRTAAWDDLKRSLKGQYDDTVWDHLAGTTSAPFQASEHRQVAVKVIDDRGNELMIVKSFPGE